MKLSVLSTILAIELGKSTTLAFAFTSNTLQRKTRRTTFHRSTASDVKRDDDAFSAFAESIDEDDLFSDDDASADTDVVTSWQESLEMLLDPNTPAAKRQILLSDLVNSNDVIRNDLQSALKDRKVRMPIHLKMLPTGSA